jgi:hypothetical protein
MDTTSTVAAYVVGVVAVLAVLGALGFVVVGELLAIVRLVERHRNRDRSAPPGPSPADRLARMLDPAPEATVQVGGGVAPPPAP